MKVLLALGAVAAGALCLPAVALLAVVAVSGAALGCAWTGEADGVVAASAPVPDRARTWVALTHLACPALPTPWIAAVMAQESSFNPAAYTDDANGGTWGLFQLNAANWTLAYGASPPADLDHDGVPDIEEPAIHASVAGKYLCQRLDGVRRLRATHPGWTVFGRLSDLQALVIAHNAGEGWLPRYPDLPGVTRAFLSNVDQRVHAWTAPIAGANGADSRCPDTGQAPAAGVGPPVGSAVAGDPAVVAAAVQRAQLLAQDRSGWLHWCDRLVCRAYGYTSSGYVSAVAHWNAMKTAGLAHPGDRCPPTGAFLFWTTTGPYGHAALITHADPGCDPAKTLVLSNMVLDRQYHASGGSYIVTLSRIEAGFVLPSNYLGWSRPHCAGDRT